MYQNLTILYIFETIHFFIGFLACIFDPETVINSYAVVPNTDYHKVFNLALNRDIEVAQVFTAFYLSFIILCVNSTIKCSQLKRNVLFFNEVKNVSLQFFLFYSMLFLYDLRTIYYFLNDYHVITITKDRFIIICVHLCMVIIHLIVYYILEKRNRTSMKKQQHMV